MKPYRLKHVPSGLYYQPHKHRGSHLSKNGKIYQTKYNGLSEERDGFLTIRCEKDTRMHKDTQHIFNWTQCRWDMWQVESITKVSDWVIENI